MLVAIFCNYLLNLLAHSHWSLN